jgi:hypothetical protein
MKKTDLMNDLSIGKELILKWVLKIMVGKNPLSSEYGPVTGSCGHGNKYPGSKKCVEFLNQLSDYQFFKTDSASLSYYLKELSYSLHIHRVR